MSKARVRKTVLVTDLDNTLFDWVGIWYHSFSEMLNEVSRISGIDKDRLASEFKEVHRRHGTSEYAFSINELPSLQSLYPGEDLSERFEPAISAFRKARKERLHLYPTVFDTLRSIKANGGFVVGFTESMAFYAMYRLKRLRLDGVLDLLYSPADHDLPEGLNLDQVRALSPDQYKLIQTEHRHIPVDRKKPSPDILLQIIDDIGADFSEVVYVGDNLSKDIVMARDAGITSVHAVYGESHAREEYELLKAVTHWTEEEVAREQRIKRLQANPDFTVSRYGDLLTSVEFSEFIPAVKALEPEEASLMMEAWKQCVDVQKHFNDIELRIRNFALTSLTAFGALAGVGLQNGMAVDLFAHHVSISVFLLGTAIFVWLGFYFMDRYWYHNLLKGAVKQGMYIEKRLRRVLPESGLAGMISRTSPQKFPLVGTLGSSEKIDFFYLSVACVLLLLVLLLLATAEPVQAPPHVLG